MSMLRSPVGRRIGIFFRRSNAVLELCLYFECELVSSTLGVTCNKLIDTDKNSRRGKASHDTVRRAIHQFRHDVRDR